LTREGGRYFFYKNTLYAMTAMWLCRHNGYSGMSLFDGLVGSAYNLILTSGPIFVVVRAAAVALCSSMWC
jgi:magnesium-transporting ATPase (P-type)